jgi:hypothetical protein
MKDHIRTYIRRQNPYKCINWAHEFINKTVNAVLMRKYKVLFTSLDNFCGVPAAGRKQYTGVETESLQAITGEIIRKCSDGLRNIQHGRRWERCVNSHTSFRFQLSCETKLRLSLHTPRSGNDKVAGSCEHGTETSCLWKAEWQLTSQGLLCSIEDDCLLAYCAV